MEETTSSHTQTSKSLSLGSVSLSTKLSYLKVPEGMGNGRSCNLPLFPSEKQGMELEEYRNKYALRLQKGLAGKVIAHQHAREIFFWLEIKPLFLSGVIFSSGGKYPYAKLADFVGEGVSTVRKKIVILKRMKLLSFDREKNLHLASYEKLREIFKHHTSKKYKLLNNGETQFTVKNVAIYENLNKQKFIRDRKILKNELKKILAERTLDPINSNVCKEYDFRDCEQYFSKSFLRKFRKYIRNNMDVLIIRYQKIYDARILQLEFGFPEINPDVTLSCKGIARVLNRSSRACGHYQTKKLTERKYLFSHREYCKIGKSPAIYEALVGMRNDIYSFKYPIKSKRWKGKIYCGSSVVENETEIDTKNRIKLHFRNMPNALETRMDAIFF